MSSIATCQHSEVPGTKSTALLQQCFISLHKLISKTKKSRLPLLVSLGEPAVQREDVLGRHQVVLCWLVPVFICLLAVAAKANKVGECYLVSQASLDIVGPCFRSVHVRIKTGPCDTPTSLPPCRSLGQPMLSTGLGEYLFSAPFKCLICSFPSLYSIWLHRHPFA